ncbi:MAG TPA: hypothetical protein VHK44_02685, partial [Xanthobacteraceae bacterium]|nr:hypothetical protein [Xanthobacteraceae bacterium]
VRVAASRPSVMRPIGLPSSKTSQSTGCWTICFGRVYSRDERERNDPFRSLAEWDLLPNKLLLWLASRVLRTGIMVGSTQHLGLADFKRDE